MNGTLVAAERCAWCKHDTPGVCILQYGLKFCSGSHADAYAAHQREFWGATAPAAPRASRLEWAVRFGERGVDGPYLRSANPLSWQVCRHCAKRCKTREAAYELLTQVRRQDSALVRVVRIRVWEKPS